MSRPAHFLDPYKFQIEEMVKLGCTDEHICRVLEDITGKEVKKRVIANKRMWLSVDQHIIICHFQKNK